MEPWQHYLNELRRRAGRIPDHAFGRAELLAEAAHDAYEATTNHLTGQGWDEESALTVTRAFGQTVKEWITDDDGSWETLETELSRKYAVLTDHAPGS
jgi:hypothetical protein